MLFFNKYVGRSDLFEGLSIWEDVREGNCISERYRELQGTFPVIFLSFANVKAMKYADMQYKITKIIADLYGMIVNLADLYKIRSNRERGYGRYDVMIEPFDKTKKAFIFEFKILDPDEDEETLEDTLKNAHAQIEEKQYEAELIADGFSPRQIRKYAFAFKGKKCLVG